MEKGCLGRRNYRDEALEARNFTARGGITWRASLGREPVDRLSSQETGPGVGWGRGSGRGGTEREAGEKLAFIWGPATLCQWLGLLSVSTGSAGGEPRLAVCLEKMPGVGAQGTGVSISSWCRSKLRGWSASSPFSLWAPFSHPYHRGWTTTSKAPSALTTQDVKI